MSGTGKPRRSYESPRRREQANATRRALLEAARALFVERGYVAATIDAIASRAGVSPETVYATFTNKRTLLSAVFDVSITGDDAPVPLLERAWVQELREEPDAALRARILAHNGRLILERIAPIVEVVRSAAWVNPEIASVWDRYTSQRLAGQRELVTLLGGPGGLRPGLSTKEAGDVLFTLGSPETYRLLTLDRGWSPDRFERWYADALTRLLLRPSAD
jgi:AcrR family transcriptional regulator